ncbi:MAG: copper-binding protein [Candidatus Omnitrophota bacterium]
MKQFSCSLISALIALVIFGGAAHAANSEPKSYNSKGEVALVSPLFSRISIQHDAIKGFSEAGETEFVVADKNALNTIQRGDLVEFRIVDERGDVRLDKIVKTGVAPIHDDKIPVGRAVQGVIEGAGQAVSAVTAPIQPVNEVASNTMNAATGATGAVLNDANPEVKKDF